MYNGQCGFRMSSFMGGGMLIIIFCGIILLFLVYTIINYSKKSNNISNNEAIKIIEQRYANGEIDKDEFTEKRNMLNHK